MHFGAKFLLGYKMHPFNKEAAAPFSRSSLVQNSEPITDLYVITSARNVTFQLLNY